MNTGVLGWVHATSEWIRASVGGCACMRAAVVFINISP